MHFPHLDAPLVPSFRPAPHHIDSLVVPSVLRFDSYSFFHPPIPEVRVWTQNAIQSHSLLSASASPSPSLKHKHKVQADRCSPRGSAASACRSLTLPCRRTRRGAVRKMEEDEEEERGGPTATAAVEVLEPRSRVPSPSWSCDACGQEGMSGPSGGSSSERGSGLSQLESAPGPRGHCASGRTERLRSTQPTGGRGERGGRRGEGRRGCLPYLRCCMLDLQCVLFRGRCQSQSRPASRRTTGSARVDAQLSSDHQIKAGAAARLLRSFGFEEELLCLKFCRFLGDEESVEDGSVSYSIQI